MPKYICDKCDEKFKKKAELTEHLLSHKYECPKCDMSFSRKKDLEKHRSAHKKKKTYECDKCDEIFNKKSDLEEHLLLHSKRYECSYCGEIFKKKKLYKEHINECDERDEYDESELPSENNNPIIPGIAGFPSKINLDLPGLNTNAKTKMKINIFIADKNGEPQLIHSIDASDLFRKKQDTSIGWIENTIDELTDMITLTKPKDIDDIVNDMSDFLDEKAKRKIKRIYRKYDMKDMDNRKKAKSLLEPILWEKQEELTKARNSPSDYEDLDSEWLNNYYKL